MSEEAERETSVPERPLHVPTLLAGLVALLVAGLALLDQGGAVDVSGTVVAAGVLVALAAALTVRQVVTLSGRRRPPDPPARG